MDHFDASSKHISKNLSQFSSSREAWTLDEEEGTVFEVSGGVTVTATSLVLYLPSPWDLFFWVTLIPVKRPVPTPGKHFMKQSPALAGPQEIGGPAW